MVSFRSFNRGWGTWGVEKYNSHLQGQSTSYSNVNAFQMSVEEDADFVYCGTDSGDIVKLVAVPGKGGKTELLVQACAAVKRKNGSNGERKSATAGKFSGGITMTN